MTDRSADQVHRPYEDARPEPQPPPAQPIRQPPIQPAPPPQPQSPPHHRSALRLLWRRGVVASAVALVGLVVSDHFGGLLGDAQHRHVHLVLAVAGAAVFRTLLFARPFGVGDTVVIRSGALGGRVVGTVSGMTLTYVSLATDDGTVLLPNSAVLAAAIGPAHWQG